MKKVMMALLVIYAVFMVTACPKSKVQTAQKKSAETVYQLSGLVKDLAVATDRAYEEQLLTVATKDKAVEGLRLLNTGVKRLTELVGQIEVNNEAPTPQALAVINKVLSDDVISPFLGLLTDFGAIAVEKSTHLRTVISAIRVALLTISNAMADAGSPVNIGGLANA